MDTELRDKIRARQKELKKTGRPLGRGLGSLISTEVPPLDSDIAKNIAQKITDKKENVDSTRTSSFSEQEKQAEQTESKDRVVGISQIPVDKIVPNVYQPRRNFENAEIDELAESIKANGIIQPLVVRRNSEGGYMLIAGERRLRAAKKLGLKLVPVTVRQSSDKEALEIAVIENVQRKNLNCVDIALAYFQLMEDFKLTQQEIATRVGKDRASVANHIRLLKLPEEVLDSLKDGKITFGHGKAILALDDTMQRVAVKNEVIEKNLSVRATERLVQDKLTNESKPSKVSEQPDNEEKRELKEVANRIGRAYGTKVALKGSSSRGKIVINYFSKHDLERLVEQLQR